MRFIFKPFSKQTKLFWVSAVAPAIFLTGFTKDDPTGKKIVRLTAAEATARAKAIEATENPILDAGLSMHVWGVDSLIADPIAIDIDDKGRLFYTRTNRQKSSEFDIRGHQDWEIPSISLQTVEDRRAFLRKTLAPNLSGQNNWLPDMNQDGSHDWRDLTVQKEYVFRVEDTDGDGIADFRQLVVEDFNDEVTDVAHGVLAHNNELYVTVAPDMWKLRDKDGDGLMDEKKSLMTGFGVHIGFSGHGLSGLEVGPDGKIYWQIGDIGFNGKGPDGKKWEYPNSGVVVRCNPDGSDFEVFASGNRNTHEFVFDEYGNLISHDNDGDHAGEKERLVYIVNGADIGWRSNWQYGKYRDPDNNTYKVWMDENMYKPRFEGQAAYFTPTIANYVSGPAGMLYNPGTALSPKYKNHFFVGEFTGSAARSGIHAFTLKPKGAGFELGETKKIVGNVLGTGIDFGPDGAMYVADWINGWGTKNNGRIWKLDDKSQTNSPERQLTKTLLAADFAKKTDAELSEILKNPDMRVRQKAQFELANRGEKGAAIFQKNIKQSSNQLARVHGIWGMSQLARQDKIYAKTLVALLKDKDPEIRAQAAKWLGDMKYAEAGKALVPVLQDNYSRARFFAAEALGRIAYEPAVNPIIALLKNNNDEDTYLRHAGSLALARIGKAEPLVALAKDQSRALRIAAVVALRRMSHPGIASFLSDQDEFVVTETARAINDDLCIPAALPALGNLLATTKFTNEALIRRAINANLRVGSPEAMQNLINYAQKEGNPVAMRAEALDALSTWAKPSVLDRVDGHLRGVVQRDAALLVNKTSNLYINMLQNPELPLRMSGVKAISKLKIAQGSEALFSRLKTDKEPSMRVEALRALAAMPDKQISKAIEQALSDQEKTVRVAALDLLGKTNMAPDLMVSLLSEVINTRTTEEKQAALLTLGKLPVKNTQKVFNQLLTQMANGKLAPEIQLELEEAIDSTRSTQLISQYKNQSAKLSPDALMASFKGSLLGGEPETGRRVFFRHQTAQCIRCHSYDDLGGNAGPRLNGIANRLSREQLLEALINPSARLAPGFGTVTLTLKDGKSISGILQGETNTNITVKVGDQPEKTIRKDQVAKRTNAPSSMPEMRYLLTKREIRDVVSFLATLKEEE
ncbi:HEAT repeat domain-containing protein [Adhaeribacter swui]|uniref:HEAT repeat domain-containing protein n=1 Tax=Adhaeribacter swui TaxID=2086471 RepID=A0A7G7GD86_9BACT|nr:HEAT repeat domain-containing protein [Adhaeribacter swui]QNF35120.1 HEAT repeat domain-containing protein [Adhaeribacter swui]